MTTPAAALPPLPDPRHRGPDGTGSYFDAFTADQMRAYGAECIRLALESETRTEMAPVAYANPVILLPADEEDLEVEWTAKVQGHQDDVFSLPLYAAPPAVSHVPGWQQIETAPKSKERVLVISQSGTISVETGHYAHNMLHAAKIDGDECHYTHWMPLPAAPKASEGAATDADKGGAL
jgi:hypothetical protein